MSYDTLTDQELDHQISFKVGQLKGLFQAKGDTPPGVKDFFSSIESPNLSLTSIASQDTKFDRWVKVADAFQEAKVTADPEKSKSPFPPKKKDEDIGQIVNTVVDKEVDKAVEQELVHKVRDMIKKLQPKQKVEHEVSDEEILQAVRDELGKKLSTPQVPITSSLHQVVDKTLQAFDKLDNGETISLGGDNSVVILGKVAGQGVAQWYSKGKPTGLFCKAHADGVDPVKYYTETFLTASTEKTNPEPDGSSNQTENNSVKSNLVIRYIPDAADLNKCAFVARKGNLEVRQSASKLLSDATQKAILAFEKKQAAGKVEHGVGEYDSTKGKVDVKVEEGKEKSQPGELTKNLGGVEKGIT